MPVTMPGRAIGRITMNEIASRPKNRERATAAAAMLPSTSATIVARRRPATESQQRVPDLRVVPGHAEPLGREAGRRERRYDLIGGERVEDDEAEREPEEQDAESDRTAVPAPAAMSHVASNVHQSASNAPMRRAMVR